MELTGWSALCVCLLGCWLVQAAEGESAFGDQMAKLVKHYKSMEQEPRRPLFPREMLSKTFKEVDERALLTVALDKYEVMLGEMQAQTDEQEVKDSLVFVQDKVKDLQGHLSPSLGKHLKDILEIKTADSEVQRQALLDLGRVYQLASQLHQRKRSRRQARRVTKPRL